MTQTPPPARPGGQIESPNPVELFWEKNRRLVITVVAAAAFALGLNYAITYFKQAEIDALWGTVATSTNLDEQYKTPEVVANPFLPSQGYPSQVPGLISKVGQHVGKADAAALADALGTAAGTPAEPLLIWASAHQALGNQEWERAVGFLEDLKRRFPEHPYCVTTDYPLQYRKPVDNEHDHNAAPPAPNEEPELVDAVASSPVDLVLARIEREQVFQQEASRFYEPISPPEDSPRVRVTTSLGTFTLALFQERAPEHVEKFLKLVEDKFYDEQHVDEIARSTSPFEPPVEEFHFGLKSSKSQVRTGWDRTAEHEQLEFVDTPSQAELSHFPGTLAAAAGADGKSSAERYWINVNDCATAWDGERVIVGRVVEGMDVVELIVGAPFFTDAEATAGRGQPRELIRIEKIEKL